jgi:Domain of unknown function (DUF397)
VGGGQAGEPAWHSGHPCESGHCVEVGAEADTILIRSSLDPDVHLRIGREEWAAFLGSAKDGLFDAV